MVARGQVWLEEWTPNKNGGYWKGEGDLLNPGCGRGEKIACLPKLRELYTFRNQELYCSLKTGVYNISRLKIHGTHTVSTELVLINQWTLFNISFVFKF